MPHRVAEPRVRPQDAGGVLSREPVHDLVADAQATANGFRRVRLEDKRVINGSADVNQLVPFKYRWALEKYIAACANHWMPQEVNMQRDIELWKNPSGLTDDERLIVKRNLGFFRHPADSLAANNMSLARIATSQHPECRQYLLRQAFEEAIHTHAYQYIVESLGLDEAESSTPITRSSRSATKDEFLIPFIEGPDQSDLQDRPDGSRPGAAQESDRVRVPDGRLVLLRRLRAGPGDGTPEQDDGRLRAVPVHTCATSRCTAVSALISSIRSSSKNPHLWTPEFREEIPRAHEKGRRPRIRVRRRHDAPVAVLGLNATMFKEYLRFIANRRCQQIGVRSTCSTRPTIRSRGWRR